MLSISSIPTEAEEFHPVNFTVVSMPLVFMPAMKRLIFSSLGMMDLMIEDSMQENSKLHSLLTMLLLTLKSLEDHPTIVQDQSEEMIASNQELLKLSKACGELILELKMLPSFQDKDLLPDQVSMLMKLSTLLTSMDQDPSAQVSSKETSNQEDTSLDTKRPIKFSQNSTKTTMDLLVTVNSLVKLLQKAQQEEGEHDV
jgi:hypothetical protein